MKYFYLIFVAFLSINAIALSNNTNISKKKPNGIEIFNLLLSNLNFPLSSETQCQMDVPIGDTGRSLLRHQLALNLSLSSGDTNNIVRILTQCISDKYNDDKGKLTDGWNCTIEIIESNRKGEYISSSSISFILDLNKKKIIKGTIRCL